MAKIQFVDELPDNAKSGAGRTAWGHEEAAALRARPRVWACVAGTPEWTTGRIQHMAICIRNGRSRPWRPAGEFEAAIRTIDGNKHLFARYVGENREHADQDADA